MEQHELFDIDMKKIYVFGEYFTQSTNKITRGCYNHPWIKFKINNKIDIKFQQ